jgi:hypothetical protein
MLKNLIDLIEDPQTPERCSNVAKKYFSLEKGASEYENLYQQLIQQ